MSQHDLIISYITAHGSITPMDAYGALGITKLATRVSELRRRGVEFEITMEKGHNKFGKAVRYARYRLKGD